MFSLFYYLTRYNVFSVYNFIQIFPDYPCKKKNILFKNFYWVFVLNLTFKYFIFSNRFRISVNRKRHSETEALQF